MKKFCQYTCLFILFISSCLAEAKQAQLTPSIVAAKINEIMKAHATYHELTPELVKRALENYIDELDPNKTYFIESDISQWIEPSNALLEQVLSEFNQKKFTVFEQIQDKMVEAVHRHQALEKQINIDDLPKHVNPKEFKDMKWTQTEEELLTRLGRIKALQIEASQKLDSELKDKALQRIEKHRTKREEEVLTTDPSQRNRLIFTNVLKAVASALDAHTAYFTPDEAAQFMISVQQRLFGIGAQLRDDLNGFTVVKIIEGGPAALGKQLKVKDRIIAVNGEPVVGMDIIHAVDLIRGKETTPVTLTVIREVKEGEATKDEKLDIIVYRGEVVLKETRYEVSYQPFGDGIIGYIRLFSFYQDPESSSAGDITKAIHQLQLDHKLKGLILDLRYNTGGMLSQAVEVTGLFITKGVVVSIKDSSGTIQHLRDLDGKTIWDGPLEILVNRASASASEIVAQALQDYGRALIIGDDHTFGKGTFQTFTLNASQESDVNPEGEYKVTRGKYYTVSGKTPQLKGVHSDVVMEGPLSEMEIGEQFEKYPLQNDNIRENFDDDLSDIPFTQRNKIRILYKFDLQPRLTTYLPYIDLLKTNSAYRVLHSKNYQKFLKELKKEDRLESEEIEFGQFGQEDLQLIEAYNIMKDLIELLSHKSEG